MLNDLARTPRFAPLRTLVSRETVNRWVPIAARDVAKEARRRFRREPREWEFVGYRWPSPGGAARPRGWNEGSVARRYAAVWNAYRAVVESTKPLAVIPELAPDRDLSRLAYDAHDVMFHNATMTFAYAVGRAALGRERVRVLDWGGATGHYSLLVRALFPELQVEYHCKEVPETSRVGRQIAPEVVFLDDAGPIPNDYDLVVASNSLQYEERWSSLLAQLLRASRGFVLLHQVPTVHTAPTFAVIQRPYRYGYATEYVGWCFRREDLLRASREHGARLVREFVHGFKPPVAGAPDQPEYRGYLFDVRKRGGMEADGVAP
jgi:putative methyltransferase (TIGR04325 family)